MRSPKKIVPPKWHRLPVNEDKNISCCHRVAITPKRASESCFKFHSVATIRSKARPNGPVPYTKPNGIVLLIRTDSVRAMRTAIRQDGTTMHATYDPTMLAKIHPFVSYDLAVVHLIIDA